MRTYRYLIKLRDEGSTSPDRAPNLEPAVEATQGALHYRHPQVLVDGLLRGVPWWGFQTFKTGMPGGEGNGCQGRRNGRWGKG
jgi:hypothetical protein